MLSRRVQFPDPSILAGHAQLSLGVADIICGEFRDGGMVISPTQAHTCRIAHTGGSRFAASGHLWAWMSGNPRPVVEARCHSPVPGRVETKIPSMS